MLIYALALQSFIFALDIVRPALAAEGSVWAGLVLCSHSGSGTSVPDTPAQAPVDHEHCPFCFAGAIYVNAVPPAAAPYSKAFFTHAVWLLATPRLVALVVNGGIWPRGPPAAA